MIPDFDTETLPRTLGLEEPSFLSFAVTSELETYHATVDALPTRDTAYCIAVSWGGIVGEGLHIMHVLNLPVLSRD